MTPEELARRAAPYFTADEDDQPELALEPAHGRAGAAWAFLRARAQRARVADLWDPIDQRDVPGDSEPDPGARVDAGRAESLVAAFEGISHAGVDLPEITLMAPPLTVFWDAGPAWEDPGRIAAFLELLGDLERHSDVRARFAADDGQVQVGPHFAAIYREWHTGAR